MYLLVSILLTILSGTTFANTYTDAGFEIYNYESCTKIHEYLKKNKLNEIALEDAPYIGKYLENWVVFDEINKNMFTGEYVAYGTTCDDMKVVLEDTPRKVLGQIEIGKKYYAGFQLKRPLKSVLKDIPRQPIRFKEMDSDYIFNIKSSSKEAKLSGTMKVFDSTVAKIDTVRKLETNGINYFTEQLYVLAPEQFKKCYKSQENSLKKLKKKLALLKKAEIYTYEKSTFNDTTILAVEIQPESLYKSCIKKEDLEKIYLKKVLKEEDTMVGYTQKTYKYTK